MPKLVNVKYSLTPHQVAKLKQDDENGIYANIPDEGIKASMQYGFGENSKENVKIFGDVVCQNMVREHIKFWIAGRARKMLAMGKTPEEIQEAFYNPETMEVILQPSETSTRGKSAAEKEADRISKIDDPAKKKAEIEAMRAKLAELEASEL